MKALQCVELGMPDKLQVNEVPEPELLDGHVIIENKACSINSVSYTHLTLPTSPHV